MILFCDSFDHYDSEQFADKWDVRGGALFGPGEHIAVGGGRFGTNCLQIQDNWNHLGKFIPDSGSLIVGVAFNPGSNLGQAACLFRFFRDGNLLCDLRVNASNRVILMAGDGITGSGNFVQIAASPYPLRAGCFTYIEAMILFSPTFGAAVIKIQGSEVINVGGLDTGYNYCTDLLHCRYTVADTVHLAGHIAYVRSDFSVGPSYDDFYLCDTSGGECNNFLGDVSIDEKLPISDGYYQQFIRSSGSDGYALLDDPYNAVDESSWVAEKIVGKKDTYNFPNLAPGDGTVYAVVINYFATKTDSGTRKIRALARQSAVDGGGSEINLPVGFAFHQSFMTRDVNNNLWTVASVNAAEFGQEITA